MKIGNNDISTSPSQAQASNSKVVELIASLSAKPLLIDKLSISGNHGTLLQLLSSEGKISLQLPLKTSQELQLLVKTSENSNAAPRVILSLNTRNQVQLTLVNSAINSGQKLNSSGINPAMLSNTSPSMVFSQAQWIEPMTIKLDKALSDKLAAGPFSSGEQKLAKQLNSQPISTTAQANNNGIKANLNQLNQPQLNQLSRVSLNQISANQLAAVDINAKVPPITPKELTQAIKMFLSQSFPKQTSLADNISALRTHVQSLQKALAPSVTTSAPPAANRLMDIPNTMINQSNKLTQQINHLLTSIQKNNLDQAPEISSRVQNSGNLFENQLKTASDISQSVKNLYSKSAQSSPATTQNLDSNKPDAANTNRTVQAGSQWESMASGDIKLKLIQIKIATERLLTQMSSGKFLSTTTGREAASQSAASTLQPNNLINSNEISDKLIPARDVLLANDKSVAQVRYQGKQPQLSMIQFNQIQKLLSEVLVEVRSAMSQIESNQLLSLRTEQPNLHQFLVDLPFANGSEIDSFELLFEHHLDQSSKSTKRWKVVVRFDLEPLGPMFAQVELKDERISTDIFAESQSTAKLINEHLHVLQKSLHEAGVNIDKVSSSQGNIPDKLIKNTEHSVDLRI